MKVINQIAKFLNIACAIFTFVTLLMVTYNLVAGAPNYLVMASKTNVWELYWQAMFFAAVTSLSVVIVDLFKNLNSIIARLIKFIISYGAFAMWFFVMSVAAKSGNMTGLAIFAASMIFVIIYSAVILLKNVTRWLLIRIFGEVDDSYVSLFDSIRPAVAGNDSVKKDKKESKKK